jgi:hypothetical protein
VTLALGTLSPSPLTGVNDPVREGCGGVQRAFSEDCQFQRQARTWIAACAERGVPVPGDQQLLPRHAGADRGFRSHHRRPQPISRSSARGYP